MGLSTRASRLLHKCRGNDTIFVLKQQSWFCCSCCHGRPQKFFLGGQSRHFAYVFVVVDDATQIDVYTYTKEKMSNVTATVAYSSFLVRKLYTEQMFVLVSMEIVRLS